MCQGVGGRRKKIAREVNEIHTRAFLHWVQGSYAPTNGRLRRRSESIFASRLRILIEIPARRPSHRFTTTTIDLASSNSSPNSATGPALRCVPAWRAGPPATVAAERPLDGRRDDATAPPPHLITTAVTIRHRLVPLPANHPWGASSGTRSSRPVTPARPSARRRARRSTTCRPWIRTTRVRWCVRDVLSMLLCVRETCQVLTD